MKRTEVLTCRFTTVEMEEIRNSAAARNLSVSEFVRKMLTNRGAAVKITPGVTATITCNPWAGQR